MPALRTITCYQAYSNLANRRAILSETQAVVVCVIALPFDTATENGDRSNWQRTLQVQDI